MDIEGHRPFPLVDDTKEPNPSDRHPETPLRPPSRSSINLAVKPCDRRRMVFASLIGAAVATVGWQSDVIPAALGAQAATRKTHRVVILVDSDDENVMHHALGYSINLDRYYSGMGQPVAIEIVATGSGLRLFRTDTSPLQEPLTALRNTLPNVSYSACNSSKLIAEAREGHAMPLLAGARLVPFGIGRVIDLQEAGWTYVHA